MSGPWQTPPTPGPWVSRDVTDSADPDCGNWIVQLPETPGNTVTRLWFGDMETNTGEDIANANLVASAPDLYAALAAIVDVANYPTDPETFDKRILAAQLALAKARGEVPA